MAYTQPQNQMMEKVCEYRIGKRTRIVTRKDFADLKGEGCLNDNHIDIFLNWVARTAITNSRRQEIHIFSAVFYGALKQLAENPESSACQTRVELAMRKANLAGKKLVLIPVLESHHWTLASVSREGIVIHDSLKPHNMEATAGYIRLLYHKYCTDKSSNAALPLTYAECPQQTNFVDCGLHVIRNADHCLRKYCNSGSGQDGKKGITRELLVKVLNKWAARNNNTGQWLAPPKKATLYRMLRDMQEKWTKGRYIRKDVVVRGNTYRLIVTRKGKGRIKELGTVTH